MDGQTGVQERVADREHEPAVAQVDGVHSDTPPTSVTVGLSRWGHAERALLSRRTTSSGHFCHVVRR